MAEVKQDAMYKKKYFETIAKVILNNKQFSDVTFVVNKKNFYASRIHMSAASQVFASLLNEHFANTTDKEVVLTNIKQDNSFLGILLYIHGIEFNLAAVSKLVLCELIDLAKRFKLVELHDDLKAYVSNIRQFKINSVVAMLNTARTYDLTKLYDKLKEFIYQHPEKIINHKTFVNLKYEVLVDLLKSNWLFADEVDILRAALNWHNDNIIDIEIVKSKFDQKYSEVGMETQIEENLNDEDVTKKKRMKMNSDEIVLCEVVQVQCDKSNENSTEEIIKIDVPKKEKLSSVVEKFSGNILRVLLDHIRFRRIPMFDYLAIVDVEPFKKYKDNILKKQYDDLNNDKRTLYEDPKKGYSKLLFTVTGLEKLTKSEYNYSLFSKENHSVKQMEWNIKAKIYNKVGEFKPYLGLFLVCRSIEKEWKVNASFDLTLLTNNPFLDNSRQTMETSNHTCLFDQTHTDYGWASFIEISYLSNPENGFIKDDSIRVEILLKIKE